MIAFSIESTSQLCWLALALTACGAATAPGDLDDFRVDEPRDAGRPSSGHGDAGPHAGPPPASGDSGTDAATSPADASGPDGSDASWVGDDDHPVASCFQLDPQHTGAIEDISLAQPLTRLWDV